MTDVWETAEQFGQYMETHLKGATAAAGITGAPDVQVLPVHATLSAAMEV